MEQIQEPLKGVQEMPAANTTADHVHLLIQLAVADPIPIVKDSSAPPGLADIG
ncbi:MAG TPA: hypothetical protein PKW95_14910 [bacterium]|nr:hypothetical protein [bacterium]